MDFLTAETINFHQRIVKMNDNFLHDPTCPSFMRRRPMNRSGLKKQKCAAKELRSLSRKCGSEITSPLPG